MPELRRLGARVGPAYVYGREGLARVRGVRALRGRVLRLRQRRTPVLSPYSARGAWYTVALRRGLDLCAVGFTS